MICSPISELSINGGLGNIETEKTDDLFIVCASYEKRCLTVTKLLSTNYFANCGVIYINDEFVDLDESGLFVKHINILRETLKSRCDHLVEIRGSWLDAVKQWKAITDTLATLPKPDTQEMHITIDITTFNREALMVILEVLRNNYIGSKIRTIYTSPEDHGCWLSRGYRHIRNVLGFPGVQNPNKPNLLVILSGFEPERTMKLIDEYEPSKVLLGIGNPPTDDKFLVRNKTEQAIILSRQEVECFEFPARDTAACYVSLEKTIGTYLSKYNIIIAPMSTKLSTLATMLLAEKYPDIQITYCLPGEYNTKDYSRGEKDIYLFDLPQRVQY